MVFGALGHGANQVLIKIRGDNKDFQGALKSSETSMSGFTSKMKAAGPMIGAAFAGAAVGFIAMSVKMAAAEEAVSRQTEALLKSQGVMWKSVSSDLNAYMKDLEELTAYNDTDLQMAFNTMIAAGMSYTEAMENMNTVTSMAYSLNRDLTSMAQLLGKAYNGQTGELSRYGIVLGDTVEKGKEVEAIQAHVNKNFADATARTDTLEGQMDLLNHEMSNFAEAVGDRIIPQLTNMIKIMNETGQSSDSLGTKLGTMITAPLAGAELFGKQIRRVLDINKIRADGADTEEEVLNWLGLQSSKLAEMADAEFERKMYVLEGMGYAEKVGHLELARAYGLSQEERSLQNIVDLEKERTNEVKEQLSLTEKKAAYDKRIGAGERAAFASGRGITGRMEDIKAGRIITAAGFKERYGKESPFVSAVRSGI